MNSRLVGAKVTAKTRWPLGASAVALPSASRAVRESYSVVSARLPSSKSASRGDRDARSHLNVQLEMNILERRAVLNDEEGTGEPTKSMPDSKLTVIGATTTGLGTSAGSQLGERRSCQLLMPFRFRSNSRSPSLTHCVTTSLLTSPSAIEVWYSLRTR